MVEYICTLNFKNRVKQLEGFSKLTGPDYYVGVKGKCKFAKDCIFQEDYKILILMVGVIFNKNDLLNKNNTDSWFHTIADQYFLCGDTFFTDLKGSFNGILFDKIKGKWLIFSNIQSERPIFYSKLADGFIIASSINLINEAFGINNLKLTLNLDGAYMLISHGYMLGEHTLFNEIKRIKAGFYCSIEKGCIYQNNYYRFNNLDCVSDSQEDIINNVDNLFNEAVRQQFEKDREYGFKHIATLSGGLDSRMTVVCAHELGYEEQLNTTFSQSNYIEEEIACQIAEKLRHEWIFKALDNGLFLYSLDNVTKLTGGNVFYSSVAHGFSLWSLLNLEDFGILHTGQIGTLFHEDRKHLKPTIFDGAYSNRLVEKISESVINLEEYENVELFLIHNRFLNGTNYGLSGIIPFTETFSPFYEMNFWEYSLKIPIELRYNHNIYKQWIIRKHPLAAEFMWEKTGVKINSFNIRNKLHLYSGRVNVTFEDAVKGLYRIAARKLNLKYTPSLQGMNPIDSWLNLNHDLNNFFSQYYEDNIFLLDQYPELKSDCIDLFKSGNANEKILALSLLSAVKSYC